MTPAVGMSAPLQANFQAQHPAFNLPCTSNRLKRIAAGLVIAITSLAIAVFLNNTKVRNIGLGIEAGGLAGGACIALLPSYKTKDIIQGSFFLFGGSALFSSIYYDYPDLWPLGVTLEGMCLLYFILLVSPRPPEPVPYRGLGQRHEPGQNPGLEGRVVIV